MLIIPMSSQIALIITPYLIRVYSFDLNKELGNRTKRLKLSPSIKSLISSGQVFPDEESCEVYLKAYREKVGIRCKTCKPNTKHYWFSGGKFFEYSSCRRRSSLKSGTSMERSKLSLHLWMTAFMLMTDTKKGFSYLVFQRQLDLSRYDTAFRLMQKIRVVMGRRDALYTLTDMIEMDECYVGVASFFILVALLPVSPRIMNYFNPSNLF